MSNAEKQSHGSFELTFFLADLGEHSGFLAERLGKISTLESIANSFTRALEEFLGTEGGGCSMKVDSQSFQMFFPVERNPKAGLKGQIAYCLDGGWLFSTPDARGQLRGVEGVDVLRDTTGRAGLERITLQFRNKDNETIEFIRNEVRGETILHGDRVEFLEGEIV